MTDPKMTEKQFRFLKYYAAITTVLTGVLLFGGFRQSSQSMKLEELTVQRINIVDAAGNVRVLLAGNFPPRRSELAGLLFVNSEGTESGGLVYRAGKKDGKVSAGGALTMDQYNEDQVVDLQYDQEGIRKMNGLTIADRPDTMGPELGELYRVLDPMPEGPKRDSIKKVLIAKVPLDQLPARRVFLGRDTSKSAILSLADRAGKPRLRLVVDSLGDARITFLDASGRVARTIPR
jgi:hypothetical protein